MNSKLIVSAMAAAFVATRCVPSPPADAENQQTVVPGWQWTVEQIDETVNQVRAGRDLQPDSWPGGARVAVLLSFDVDNETIALRYGEPTIGSLSQGEYGARVALQRVVELIDRHEIPRVVLHPFGKLAAQPAHGRRDPVVRPPRVRRPRLDSRAEFGPPRRRGT